MPETGLDKKTCVSCQRSLPRTEFYSHKQTRDRLRTECKDCSKSSSKAWQDENPERYKTSRKRWRRDNHERALAGVRQWRLANPDRKRGLDRSWRLGNPERVKTNTSRWRAAKRASFVEDVVPAVLFARDRGICGICELPIRQGSRWAIDHIIPLIHAGCSCRTHEAPSHSYANTRIAHIRCNGWKGGRLDSELPPVPEHILGHALDGN